MWNELESYKHHFLQKELKHMKPLHISPMVTKDFNHFQSLRGTCQLALIQPHLCQQSTFFDDHAELAYGWFALPKLMRELCSDDLKTQWRAINSLSEFLMNPLNAQRAINEKDIVRILKNAFLRHRIRYSYEKYREVEKMLEIFRILSIYYNGAKKMSLIIPLCDEFYKIIAKKEKYDDTTSAILRNLSEKPEVLLQLLNNTEAYKHLSKIFTMDVCRPYYPYNLWMHLSHFLEVSPEQGIELGFFEVLHLRICGKLPEFHKMNLKCFALLLRCEEGQKRFDEVDGVNLLYKLMSNDLELLDTYEYLIMAFLHGLQSKKAMWRCVEFTDLPKILTKYAMKRHRRNTRLQLYSLKALRQIGEMPCVKRYMLQNCERNLKTMPCLNGENECVRDRLVEWLHRDIFETDLEE